LAALRFGWMMLPAQLVGIVTKFKGALISGHPMNRAFPYASAAPIRRPSSARDLMSSLR
jgi:hypothetical protein